MNETRLLETVRQMVEKEKEYAEELRRLSEKFRHPVLQALIMGIVMDSLKHSIFYEAAEKLLREAQPMLTEEELDVILAGIKKHIETEAQMIKYTRRAAEETSDPRLKLILYAIHEDEVKHHKLLLDIQEKLAKRETFTEQDLWDAVWRDSPWHGSPGG